MKEKERMVKEIKKIAIDMLDRMQKDYTFEEIDNALKYSIDNKEIIDEFDRPSKSIEDLYNKYVEGEKVFYPVIPLTAITVDKSKADFDGLKSMILEANESNIFEMLDATSLTELPMLPEEEVEKNLQNIIGTKLDQIINLQGGK